LSKEGRNIFNLLTYIFMNLFLLDRIIGILYDLNYVHTQYEFVLLYFFFQLPQNLLEITIMVFFFSLYEVYLTLENLEYLKRLGSQVRNSHLNTSSLMIEDQIQQVMEGSNNVTSGSKLSKALVRNSIGFRQGMRFDTNKHQHSAYFANSQMENTFQQISHHQSDHRFGTQLERKSIPKGRRYNAWGDNGSSVRES
jgi:hypothetical protein